MLPEGGFRKDLLAKKLFQEYAMGNAAAWYQFAGSPDLGREAENGSLYLVTGCDKNPAWGIASYYHPSGGAELSLKFMAAGPGDGDASLAYRWEDSGPATVRISYQDRSRSSEVQLGPSASSDTSKTFNQCVFIRGFRISLETRYLRWLLGEKVKIEDGIGDPQNMEGGINSNWLLSRSAADSSSVQAVIKGGASSHGKRGSDQRVDVIPEHDVLLQDIFNVSSVRCHFPRYYDLWLRD
jgi:hypothetical protein